MVQTLLKLLVLTRNNHLQFSIMEHLSTICSMLTSLSQSTDPMDIETSDAEVDRIEKLKSAFITEVSSSGRS